jgi:hypothetical protein
MIRPLTSRVFLFPAALALFFIGSCSTEKTYQKDSEKPFLVFLVEKTNTWRGGVIGASLGQPLEGKKINEISDQALREAAQEGKPVAYLSLDGFQRVETYPVGKVKSAKCRLVRVEIFQQGKLIRDELKEFCP